MEPLSAWLGEKIIFDRGFLDPQSSKGADLVVFLVHLAVRPDDHLCAVLFFDVLNA